MVTQPEPSCDQHTEGGTRDQLGVDAVLENRRGQVVGIEVKAAATVRAEDFRGLRHLQDRLGGDFVAGIVL